MYSHCECGNSTCEQTTVLFTEHSRDQGDFNSCSLPGCNTRPSLCAVTDRGEQYKNAL